MHGVSLHCGEKRLLPFGETFSVLAVNDRFVADVLGDVVELDEAATIACLSQERRNVRSLHESGATSVSVKRSDSLIQGMDCVTTLTTNR